MSSAGKANARVAASNGNAVATNSKTVDEAVMVGAAAVGADPAATGAAGSTDAIIEELKALAKSMLDATNAARRRAHTLESRRSYEALMNAIEGRGSGNGTGAGFDINVAPAVSQASTTATNATLALAPPAVRGVRHVDPTADVALLAAGASGSVNVSRGSAGAALNADAEDLIEVPASLSPSHNGVGGGGGARKGKVTASAVSVSKDDDEAAEEDEPCLHTSEGAAAAAARGREPSIGSPSRGAAAAADEDDDDNIFDGVKTQVFFKSTDAAAYGEIASSAWKPEQLLRAADGTTVPDESDDDDEDDDGSDSSSSSSSAFSGHVATGSLGTRNRPPPSKPKRVFRVPLFPYGGGVTEDEAKELSRKFTQCIRTSSRNGAVNNTPKFIAKSAFDGNTYDDVAPLAETRVAVFKPLSPYEFVVEVERPVLFDAVHAREHRRREFRQLVKKGEAPVTMGTFNLRVIMDPIKTGFEDEKHFPIVRGSIVADRYQIVQLLGKATFSRAVRCYDLQQPICDEEDEENDDDADEEDEEEEHEGDAKEGEHGAVAIRKAKKKVKEPIGYVEVCLKIINNTKDFFDQSLDEIRLLTLINTHKDPDDAHVLRLIDAFYYKEHTMLVTELLSDNLYEYSKYNREEEEEFYFTLPRLRRIARQITEALAYVHGLNLIHADLKPENILFVSHRRCTVKVIDFGSSCFLSDHLSSYIQSRSYRAPEVVLGCDYDGRIDVWSLGAILAELVTGDVLFTSETVPEMLARIVYVCGCPFPRKMLWEGRHTCSFINKFGLIYESSSSKEAAGSGEGGKVSAEDTGAEEPYYVYTPVPGYVAPPPSTATSSRSVASAAAPAKKGKDEPYAALRRKLAAAGMKDEQFFSFVKDCLTLDHKRRPTSAELLSHPFIVNERL